MYYVTNINTLALLTILYGRSSVVTNLQLKKNGDQERWSVLRDTHLVILVEPGFEPKQTGNRAVFFTYMKTLF